MNDKFRNDGSLTEDDLVSFISNMIEIQTRQLLERYFSEEHCKPKVLRAASRRVGRFTAEEVKKLLK